MKKIAAVFFLVFILQASTPADEFCGLRNQAFQNEESIDFHVFYAVVGLYVDAGTANFSISMDNVSNRPCYHVIGTGNSNPSYDWIFKVRDRYETFIDTATLQPHKFIRSIEEGGFKKYENIVFNNQNNTAFTTNGTFKVPDCVQDVLSSIYYARNINFDKYKVGDKIPFYMFLDNEVYNLYIKYMGRETVKTKYGKFHAIKFKPLLVKGTLFSGGEKMTVWVSDDPNHIPLRIESPIVVGSVKVDMMGYKNLRYPLTSMISFN